MNDIDKMPSKCRDCPYWERAAEPYVCCDCENPVEKRESDYIMRSDAIREYAGEPNAMRFYDLIIAALERIPAADVEPKRRWIPVTERLPENYGEYLVTTEGGDPPGRYVTIWIYLAWCGKWADGDDDFVVNPDEDGVVTHWMEIPEPPKEDSDAE